MVLYKGSNIQGSSECSDKFNFIYQTWKQKNIYNEVQFFFFQFNLDLFWLDGKCVIVYNGY